MANIQEDDQGARAIWDEASRVILNVIADSMSIDIGGLSANSHLPVSSCSTDNSCWAPPPSVHSPLKKRALSDGYRERKLQKLSPSRCISSRSDTENMERSMPSLPTIPSTRRMFRRIRHPTPSLRTNLDSSRLPEMIPIARYDSPELDSWLNYMAESKHYDVLEYKQAFYQRRHQLYQYLSTLHITHYAKLDYLTQLDTIHSNLTRLSEVTNDLLVDYPKPLSDLCPEWLLFEEHVSKLASYVKCIEDIRHVTVEEFPRSDNTVENIEHFEHLIESKTKLYGDQLARSGQMWREMGLTFDQQLIISAQGRLCGLCVDLLHEMEQHCAHISQFYINMTAMAQDKQGDKLMSTVLRVIELASAVTNLTGRLIPKLSPSCYSLTILYSRWILERLDLLGRPVGSKPFTKKSHIDIHFIQLMENIKSLLTSLKSMNANADLTQLQPLAPVLVDIVLRAMGVIKTMKESRKHSKVLNPTNILANPHATLLHMEKSLVICVERIVDLAGRTNVDSAHVKKFFQCLNNV